MFGCSAGPAHNTPFLHQSAGLEAKTYAVKAQDSSTVVFTTVLHVVCAHGLINLEQYLLP